MSNKMNRSFAQEMQNMEAASLLRTEVPVQEDDNMLAQVASGKDVLNFFTNDFLGWSSRADVKRAAMEALSKYGVGGTSSRATIGTAKILTQLEQKLCEYLDVEACIVLSSRYLANIGIFDSLTNERDSIFIDEGCDHGLVDGVRFSKAKAIVFNFKDYNNLEYYLKSSGSARYRIIASDAVFNTDASYANLETIQSLQIRYDAISIVDDSLGIGILGDKGKGTCSHIGLDNPNIISGSFAYGLGNVAGGFIAGDLTLIEWLRQSSRSYLLSEPLSPVNAAVVLTAIDVLQQDDSLVEALFYNASYLKDALKNKQWQVLETEYPMVSLQIGSTLVVQKLVEALYEKGVLVSGLCYPNTPEGAARIRIHLSAKHSVEQLDNLVSALESVRHLLQK
ncbi:2-amino-3-ketobutyrate coenzyme A ligase [Thalassocella blandensis]|nr:2-amino-3-ketobutyrate coenzyme A ligase [Thalassocella blandensis]